jgi:hypothetical protein
MYNITFCGTWSPSMWLCLTFIGPCIVIYSYSKTNQMHLFLKLFILVKHSTCFGRSFHPSSGAQDCTCSNRHMSHSCCYLLLAGTRINNWRNRYILLVLLQQHVITVYYEPKSYKCNTDRQYDRSYKCNTDQTVWQIISCAKSPFSPLTNLMPTSCHSFFQQSQTRLLN